MVNRNNGQYNQPEQHVTENHYVDNVTFCNNTPPPFFLANSCDGQYNHHEKHKTRLWKNVLFFIQHSATTRTMMDNITNHNMNHSFDKQ
jgi:hypothetical protein